MAGDPTQIAADWASRLGGSRDKIQRGVQGVTVSPGALAARQADVWANNTVAAKAKFQRKTAALQLGDWQGAMINKGLDRIGTGAQAAQAKFATFMQSHLQIVASVRAGLPARGNLDANINRMVQNARGIAAAYAGRTH